MPKTKIPKRRDGPCEICGHRGCPACSETELFRSMGIRQYEMIDDPFVWKELDAQIDALKATAIAFRIKPKETAAAFAKTANKVMLIFEEICRRRVD